MFFAERKVGCENLKKNRVRRRFISITKKGVE